MHGGHINWCHKDWEKLCNTECAHISIQFIVISRFVLPIAHCTSHVAITHVIQYHVNSNDI